MMDFVNHLNQIFSSKQISLDDFYKINFENLNTLIYFALLNTWSERSLSQSKSPYHDLPKLFLSTIITIIDNGLRECDEITIYLSLIKSAGKLRLGFVQSCHEVIIEVSPDLVRPVGELWPGFVWCSAVLTDKTKRDLRDNKV